VDGLINSRWWQQMAGIWKRMGGEMGQQKLCMYSELTFHMGCCKNKIKVNFGIVIEV